MTKKVCTDYKRYNFCDNVPYKSACENIKEYLDAKIDGIDNKEVIENTIVESVDKSMGSVKNALCHIDDHLSHAEHHIIDEIHRHSGHHCHGVGKEDLEMVVDEVNKHIDDKFNEVDFIQQFQDLNQQVSDIYRRVTEE